MKGIKKMAFRAENKKQAKKIIQFFLSNGCTNKAEISNEYVGEYYAVDKEKDLICTEDLQPAHELHDLSKFLKPSKKELLKRIETMQDEITMLKEQYNEFGIDFPLLFKKEQNLEVDFEKVEAKSELEVGKWYKANNGSLCYYFGNDKCCGFDCLGYWGSDGLMTNDIISGWQLATETEVKEALIKEAERRGFKEGVTINYLRGIGNKALMDKEPKYFTDDNTLYVGGFLVFEKGKWAEIIEQPKEEIDFSQVGLIVESEYNVVVTNGEYNDEHFGGMVVSHKAGVRNRGYVGNIFEKCSFKLTKEPITISNEE